MEDRDFYKIMYEGKTWTAEEWVQHLWDTRPFYIRLWPVTDQLAMCSDVLLMLIEIGAAVVVPNEPSA